MKLNPQQAPLYGRCVVTVQLSDEELAADDRGVDYFLLFAGSTQRHLTSTLRSSHDTLQALCPAHDCCEVVLVTLCSATQTPSRDPENPASCLGTVAPLAEHRFSFVQDLAFDMAQFLVSTAGRADGLDGALLLDECQIPVQECERLDENLALALHHLVLPPEWSLLGSKQTSSTDLGPHETLLHFSARRGLSRVTRFLLRQPGAREALQLVNKEGHTPAAVATQRGHERLCELLTKAETEAGEASETLQLVSADARVCCNSPTLNTHTLTVSVRPGRIAPTLQESVEYLLHFLGHLHAKGVSVLELQLDSLHTAAECCDGAKTDLTCQERLQQLHSTSECLLSETGGSKEESSNSIVGELGETCHSEKDESLPPASEIPPRQHSLEPQGDGVCLSSNTEEKGCQGEQEGRVDSCPGLNLCDRSEGAQGKAEGESVTVGNVPAENCGKQAEEAVIREEQEAGEGEEQETGDGAATRGEEEGGSQHTILTTASGDFSVMGQSPLSGSSELLNSPESKTKLRSQDGKNIEEEQTELPQEPFEGFNSDEVEKKEVGREELMDPISTPRDLPDLLAIACSDVIERRESAVPLLLIEGLREGEPPPDINSQEQNQETAGQDYAAEQEQGSGPEAARHSGTDTGAESNSKDATKLQDFAPDEPKSFDFWVLNSAEEETRTDQSSPGNMLTKRKADQDSGVAHRVSSDDEGSFRSFGSSSTEIFHPTEDNSTMQEGNQTMNIDISSTGCTEDLNDLSRSVNHEHSPGDDNELLLDAGTINSLNPSVGSRDVLENESELLDDFKTMDCLILESCEELLIECPEQDSVLDPIPLVSEDVPTSEPGESNNKQSSNSHANIDIQAESEVKVNGPVEDDQQTDASDKPEGAEKSRNVQMQPEQDDLKETQDTGSTEGQLAISAQDSNPSSDIVDGIPLELEPPAAVAESSVDTPVEDQMAANPDSADSLHGATESCATADREVEVDKPIDAVRCTGEEDNGPGEGPDASTIHRDREASFHHTCNPQHSESSTSSAFPSLPRRTSSSTSCPSSTHRDSGSDIESLLNAEPGYDSIFRKNDEPVTGGDSTSEVSVSCSSTDDTASVGPSSSSPEGSQGLSWSPEEGIQSEATNTEGQDRPAVAGGGPGGAGDAEEEAKDRVSEVPRRSSLFRSSKRSLSPLRRHSWGPGKNNGGESEMNQRSSIRSPGEGKPAFHRRSYSLEGLSGIQEELRGSTIQEPRDLERSRMPRYNSDDRGSLVSLTEEQEEREEDSRLQEKKLRRYRPLRNSCPSMTLPLTKSVSMVTISHKDSDGMRLFSNPSGSVAYSISEEEPGPLRSDTEGRNTTKVSRTFSYLKNKMYKKTREKDRDKRDKDKETKEKDKKAVNGHIFTPVSSNQSLQCSQCNKAFNGKEVFCCTYCNASVHKGCRDSMPVCANVKMKLPKQQFAVPDSSAPCSVPGVTMRNKAGGTRDRPRSAILSPEDNLPLMIPGSRRHTSIMTFPGNNLSKSLSISNIAGPFDDIPIKGLRYLSQSTDSLNRTNQVTESMESLTDEGTEMMDAQLLGEFEANAKEFEADSWSLCVEQQYLQQQNKELVKRQDVIYELMQTEMHHIRTLRIMSEVYSKGLQKEVPLDQHTVEKMFPVLDDLLDLHSQLLQRLLDRKKESQLEAGGSEGGFVINRIGDILVSQFSGSNGESMKRVYGKFCSRHNEAVNVYKDLMNKNKNFKTFIKKKRSSSTVRRLDVPECILLVTQRITKYPVLIQRMLLHTKDTCEDYVDLSEAIRLVKEVIAAVDSKVNEHEKKHRLKEFHSRMDSKSIMILKSGQFFAREDLLRRKLIHDGALQLKNTQGRLKDVQALLLSDVLVFLQEKDQKYVFAMLDQRSTVISLQKLIVREVANKERGLFLITAGTEKPEMMEVLASSKEERNTWMQLIQTAMQSMEKDEDEGIPSETEDDKRQLESKAKEMRDMLKQKDTEIMSLLEEKVRLFREMWEGLSPGEEACRQVEPFFRSACSQEPPQGASIMKDALQEVETLQGLVNGSLGGAMASVHEGGAAGPVSLPRRAETFGGFDSHQMHGGKSGDRDESEDAVGDLRRTESDSVLKKGGNANLLQLLKRNSEQVLHSVSNLHLLLSTLQAVVVQQDSYIEDQRQALSERSSSCSSLSRQSSRPSSLIEQEKQRSLEKQRQELASLQRQQAALAEERRRREREWELREQQLSDRESTVHLQEEEVQKQHKQLDEERKELQSKKEEYQRDLERLRDAQRKLEKEREAVQRQIHRMEELRLTERTPSTTSDESLFLGSSQSLELDPLDLSSSSSSSSTLPRLQPQRAKASRKGLNPFTSSSSGSLKSSEANSQISKGFLQLAKTKSKDGKKKKKSKGGSAQAADPQHVPEPPMDGEIFFC
ncbi:A-kinase anchor protein 13 isoform X2 [Poeciliopsis prolifica]|uniref:A-kinase anchor protein 13 isoform X2 n=1 Tax=Poeciliopsis prolifica TaxID=188132 RepID=UPI002413B882|nr:A-kinase anchor protein 13 isoform X2 [Poeciliopsis prolifica]XP_054900755.1 A-kinase anchor protein 13 isoform X2 [Poeciliopsis prolifica]XP_054900756.1 A-kinase anchor protein 13 isoform X2 [Poeciliopsis prolifica]